MPRLAAFGRAAEALRSGWRDQFTDFQREIGCDEIRFHGIFSDELMVASRLADGRLDFRWELVDEVLDFILTQGARPFLELGLMPQALARDPGACRLRWNACVSPPSDTMEWRLLLRSFIDHAASRWGRKEVEAWHFEVWNEPELSHWWWTGTREEFFSFWEATRSELKDFSPRLSVGGCGFSPWGLLGTDWFGEFESFCATRGAMPDFLSYHIYPVEFDGIVETPVAGLAVDSSAELLRLFRGHASRGGPDGSADQAERIGARIDEGPFASLPRFVTEWNYSPDSRDLLHDTVFQGAWLARNLPAMAGRGGCAWWTFSDIFEEFGPGGTEFHGGFGLVTRHGLRKPAWHAMSFFARLRGARAGEGEGWIAFREGDGTLRVLVWNYRHFDESWARLDASSVDLRHRGGVFETEDDLEFRVRVDGLRGPCRLVERVVDRAHGSAFDAWLRMGAPDDLCPELLRALRAATEPGCRVIDLPPGPVMHVIALEAQAFALLEFHPPERGTQVRTAEFAAPR